MGNSHEQQSAPSGDRVARSALTIEVWFDFICPWCLIGKRQLQLALRELHQTRPEVVVQVQWHGMSLLPDLPPIDGSGADRAAYANLVFPRVAPLTSNVIENFEWAPLALVGLAIVVYENWLASRYQGSEAIQLLSSNHFLYRRAIRPAFCTENM